MTLQAGRISFGLMLAVMGAWGQVSIPSVGTPLTQDFNTLASSATSSTLPQGWAFAEAGTNANTTYTAGTGSSNTGDTYSFGAAGNTERALGSLLSGSLSPTLGASFTNNTGNTITGLAISYTGEQWRLGTTGRVDRLDFQYSVNATSLSTGTWLDVDQLDFSSPFTTTVGARDGNAAENRTAISFTISSLNIPNGATVWIRWNDFNASGADDGLAIDDFSLTAQGTGGSTCPTISLNPTSLPSGTQDRFYSLGLTASGGVGPYSFGITGGGLPTGINLSGSTISGTHAGSGTFPVTISATDSTTPTACTGAQLYSLVIAQVVTTTNINVIQGSGLASPLAGQAVITRGVVTALRSNGYYLQNEAADVDADPLTSEGVLVFTSSAPSVSVGQRLQVVGTVVEFTSSTDLLGGSTTELVSPISTLLSSGNALPVAVAIDSTLLTAGGGQQQLERFEGMRVSLPSLTVVAPTNGNVNETRATSTSNGVFTAVFTGVPTPFREPGIRTPLVAPLCEAGSGCAIPVWDNNPERIQIDSDRIAGTTALSLQVGQSVSGLVGVFENAFGVNQVFPDTTSVPVVSGSGIAEGIAPLAKTSEVTVATYNMERFFDTVDDAGGDVVINSGALTNRLNKASLGIRVNLGAPDIIGLQEIENLSVLQLLASKINSDAAGAYTYNAYLSEGNDPGGIDVAFLVKNTITTVSVMQFGKTTTYTNPCTAAQDILNDRPPVGLRGTVTKSGRTLDLVVIVNHLRSLNGINEDAGGGCTGGQRVRAKRAAQAEFLANLIQSEITLNPNVKLISVGDMNAFEVSDGYVDIIGTVTGNPAPATQVADASADLVNQNLLNLLNVIPDPAQRFSYVFDGSHQTLDHLLYTQGLKDQVTNGGYVRINSEFPETDRNDSNSARRLSDHDPGVIYVTTAQPIVSGILVQRGGLILNRTTNTYNGNLVIRNTGTVALTGPFTVALTGLPGGVSLANAAGTNFQGSYLVNSSTTIAAGGALLVPVQFSNPGNVAINYTTKVYSGAF